MGFWFEKNTLCKPHGIFATNLKGQNTLIELHIEKKHRSRKNIRWGFYPQIAKLENSEHGSNEVMAITNYI